MPVTPPTPYLGGRRYVVCLPAGLGRALSFDGAGVELGNGWFDLSARVGSTVADDWLPVSADVHGTGEQIHGALLGDHGRQVFGPLREGDVLREHAPDGPFYWLYAGGTWHPARGIELAAPRRDNDAGSVAGPVGQQIRIDEPPPSTRRKPRKRRQG